MTPPVRAPLPARRRHRDRCTHDFLSEGAICCGTNNKSAPTCFILRITIRAEAGHERNPQGGTWTKGNTIDAEGSRRSGKVVMGGAPVFFLTLDRRDEK